MYASITLRGVLLGFLSLSFHYRKPRSLNFVLSICRCLALVLVDEDGQSKHITLCCRVAGTFAGIADDVGVPSPTVAV